MDARTSHDAASIIRDRTPKGLGYPLKASWLVGQPALANGPPMSLRLWNWSGWRSGSLFVARFLPPGSEWFYGSSRPFGDPMFPTTDEQLLVTVRAMPSDELKEARAFVRNSVIPELLVWIGDIIQLPANSPVRGKGQEFRRAWPA